MIKEIPSRLGELASHARITAYEFMHLLGVGKTRFYELAKLRGFPQPLRCGRSVRWVYQEVLDYLRRQEAARG